jgi:hypothetical protein
MKAEGIAMEPEELDDSGEWSDEDCDAFSRASWREIEAAVGEEHSG